MSDLIFNCPECGLPAEITRHFVKPDENGFGMLYVEITCLGEHPSMITEFHVLHNYLDHYGYQ